METEAELAHVHHVDGVALVFVGKAPRVHKVCVCVCVCGVCVECVLSVHGVCVVRERERDKEREAVKERR